MSDNTAERTTTSKEELEINKSKQPHYQPSQFSRGHEPPIQHQPPPGLESQMSPTPIYDQLPTPTGGYAPYQPANKLANRKALITGGDSGIGRAVAVLFALEGADSVITYLPEEKSDAEETQRIVESKGRRCWILEADLTTSEACREVARKAREWLGEVNVLVNNAAFQMEKERIEELSEEQWDKTFKTNVYPFFWLAKYITPDMKSGDCVINNASINHYIGKPNLLDYTSTKGAIIAFTRALSNQLTPRNIRCNAVAPGPVWTPLVVATMTNEDLEGFGRTPLGRPAQPSEVATCFVFLAGREAAMVSGQVLHPNGGTVVGS
ncbi:NAD(P)-binding protein [Ascodesmis nigricans]|uniref:NAD(P)-binding protein n=1 Tax=Ascodesmis nigricans TaxID=341454 RepID=A0A4S2MS59_9PEZI|nr:NAD(P)-binding protein [Ascodesmis nigricans]